MKYHYKILAFACTIVSFLLNVDTVLAEAEKQSRDELIAAKKKMRKDITQSLVIILSIIGTLMVFSLMCFCFNW